MMTFEEMITAAFRNLENLDEFCDEYCDFFATRICSYIAEKFKVKCHCASGASKFVVIFDDYDYVFKIPYHQSYMYESGDLYEFEYAYDYCDLEVEKYADIMSMDSEIAELFFPKSEYVCQMTDDYSLYRQIKCDNISEFKESHSRDEITTTLANNNRRLYVSYRIADYLISNYDLNTAFDLLDRLNKVVNCCEISDLHMGNYGTLNGRPVIFDYSGYEDL